MRRIADAGIHARQGIAFVFNRRGPLEEIENLLPPSHPVAALRVFGIRFLIVGIERGWPPDVELLFWEVDPAGVDLRAHVDYVMERVMSRGTLAAMRWLKSTYSERELADFLERKGHRLSPRDCAYWRLVAGLPPEGRAGRARQTWMGE